VPRCSSRFGSSQLARFALALCFSPLLALE
jgi:hypothetical protein